MAGTGLNLDVGGSSTSAANQSTGGNAGIQFAPKMNTTLIMIVGAAAFAAWYLMRKK